MKVRAGSIRGALIMAFINRYTVLVVNFGAIMVLARLLTPAETGLFSVAASVALLAQAVRDFGISEFLVQESDLTPAKIRTAFGLTLMLSWSLGAAIFLCRNWIATAYGTPELGNLIAVLSLSFAVTPFSSTILAMLNRTMSFGVMFRITQTSNLANAIVSIWFAYLGWKAMALALGMLAASVVTALVAGFSATTWDHFIPSFREWRALATFGAYMSGANIVQQVGARAPDLIIGRMLGYRPLGLYNRASGIVALFYDLVVSSVQAVAFPAFSGAHRAGEDMRRHYLRVVTLVTGAVLPVLAMLAVLAEPLVRALLGTLWLATAPLVPLICIGIAIEALAPMVPQFLSATGSVRMVLPNAIYVRAAQVAMVGCFANFNIFWIASGQIIIGLVTFLVQGRSLSKAAKISFGALLRATRLSLGVTVLTVILPFAVLTERGGGGDSPWLSLALGGGLASICWFGAITVLRHPLRRELGAVLHEALATVRGHG